MWILSLVLGSVLISGLFGDMRQDIHKCRDDNLDLNILENVDTFPPTQELETLCPMILGFMECGEDVFERHTGMTPEKFSESFPDPVMKDAATFYINVRSIIRETCTEGSNLNAEYKVHGSCLSSVELYDKECSDNAFTAYETYKALEASLDEETSQDLGRDCMMSAYNSACLASRIHEECGQGAFEFYQQLMKRSSFFRLALCSEEQLEDLKTKFLNSLDLEEERHDLFRLAFDLRKRRK